MYVNSRRLLNTNYSKGHKPVLYTGFNPRNIRIVKCIYLFAYALHQVAVYGPPCSHPGMRGNSTLHT